MNMYDLLYKAIYTVAEIHDRILTINDAGGWYFNDKQLHFIVTGIFGLLMIFVIYPIFKLLAKYNHTMIIAWLYVFTVVLVITFSIEIGQWFSGTGRMELADVTAGVTGFLVMFAIFALIRGIFHFAFKSFARDDDSKH